MEIWITGRPGWRTLCGVVPDFKSDLEKKAEHPYNPNPYSANIFVLKRSAFYACSVLHYIQVHFRLDFIMGANTMNPIRVQ